MKKYLLPIMFLAFWSCEEEVGEEVLPEVGIVGTWNLGYMIEGFVDSSDADTIYTDGVEFFMTSIFDSVGNYNITAQIFGESKNESGTWSVTGNQLDMVGIGFLEDDNPSYEFTSTNNTLEIYYSQIYDPELNSVVFINLIFDKDPILYIE